MAGPSKCGCRRCRIARGDREANFGIGPSVIKIDESRQGIIANGNRLAAVARGIQRLCNDHGRDFANIAHHHIHVGTGLSTRLRGQENDFAVLDLDADEAKVTRMVARGEQFVPAGSRSFQFGEDGWRDRQDARSLGTGRGL